MVVEVIVREPEAVQDGLCFVCFIDMVLIFRKGETCLLEDCILGEMNVLGKMPDSIAGGGRDCARVLVLFAKNHPEKRGFAVTISAHEADSLARVYGKADAVE